jgi:branched-chain amino acid transport system ATP-binding protein
MLTTIWPGLAGGAMAFGAYWIAVWAMTQAPIALVAAVRETSVLFAAVIAVVVLRAMISLALPIAIVFALAFIAVAAALAGGGGGTRASFESLLLLLTSPLPPSSSLTLIRESPMLEITDLATSYGRIEALKGVSLQARAGEVTCLLGPNGAGKSTLMLTLAGLLKPQRGSVKLEGEELLGKTPAQIVARGMALVPENRLVFPSLSVKENLVAGAFKRRDAAGIRSDIDAMFARFPRLLERTAQLAGTLSGGEQQMLAVARALMSRPRLLLMDEPSVGLAPLVVAEIFSIVRQLHAEGVSIFLVEQNAHMALKVAQQFYLMEQGRVSFSGTPGELADDEVIQRAYLGRQKASEGSQKAA